MPKITRFLAFLIVISQTLIFASFTHADQLALPTGDIIAPQITHEPLKDSIKQSNGQQIKATVTDNIGVKTVTLFFRDEGTENYKRRQMARVGNTDDFAATLGSEDTTGVGVEYYIQAVDMAGNALLHGHSFSPLKVAISAGSSSGSSDSADSGDNEPAAADSKPAPVEDSFAWVKKTNKWVWIGLGVVAVAALSGGGGDDAAAPTGTVSFGNVATP